MEYYLISLFISIIIFIIIQYLEYNKNNNDPYQQDEPYSLFKLSNLLLLLIIYIVITIAFFYLKPSLSLFNFIKGGNNNNNNNQISSIEIKEDIDPKILSRINDNFDTGFAPFNSDDDTSSLSSLSSNN